MESAWWGFGWYPAGMSDRCRVTFDSAEVAVGVVAVAGEDIADDIVDDIAEFEVVVEVLAAVVAVVVSLAAAAVLGSVIAADVVEDAAGVELDATVPLPAVELHPAIINTAAATPSNIGGRLKVLMDMLVTIAGSPRGAAFGV